MLRGALLSFAILVVLAPLPAEEGAPTAAPARAGAPLASALPPVTATRAGVGLDRTASEGAEDGAEAASDATPWDGIAPRTDTGGTSQQAGLAAAVSGDGRKAPEPPPLAPMIIAAAVDCTAGRPCPLVVMVAPAPVPPARIVSILLSGVPPRSALSHGENRGSGIWRIGLKPSDGLWSAGVGELGDLTLTVPPDHIGTVELKITAIAVHGDRGIATNAKTVSAKFDPLPAADTILAEEAGQAPAPPVPPPAPPVEVGREVGPEKRLPPVPLLLSPVGSAQARELAAPTPAAAGTAGPDAGRNVPVSEPRADEHGEQGKPTPAATQIPAPTHAFLPPTAAADALDGPSGGREAAAEEQAVAALALGDSAPAPTPPPSAAPAEVQTVPSAEPASAASALPEPLLMRRGDALFAQGDLAGARLFYEFAAATGSGRAAFALGKTYDPLVHRKLGVRGAPPDPAKASDWYRKAVAAGNAEAENRLRDLTAWLGQGS